MGNFNSKYENNLADVKKYINKVDDETFLENKNNIKISFKKYYDNSVTIYFDYSTLKQKGKTFKNHYDDENYCICYNSNSDYYYDYDHNYGANIDVKDIKELFDYEYYSEPKIIDIDGFFCKLIFRHFVKKFDDHKIIFRIPEFSGDPEKIKNKIFWNKNITKNIYQEFKINIENINPIFIHHDLKTDEKKCSLFKFKFYYNCIHKMCDREKMGDHYIMYNKKSKFHTHTCKVGEDYLKKMLSFPESKKISFYANDKLFYINNNKIEIPNPHFKNEYDFVNFSMNENKKSNIDEIKKFINGGYDDKFYGFIDNLNPDQYDYNPTSTNEVSNTLLDVDSMPSVPSHFVNPMPSAPTHDIEIPYSSVSTNRSMDPA